MASLEQARRDEHHEDTGEEGDEDRRHHARLPLAPQAQHAGAVERADVQRRRPRDSGRACFRRLAASAGEGRRHGLGRDAREGGPQELVLPAPEIRLGGEARVLMHGGLDVPAAVAVEFAVHIGEELGLADAARARAHFTIRR